MNRITLTKIHLMLAAFMFPVALMFLITGALYIWEIKGATEPTDYNITLSSPLEENDAALKAIVEKELQRLNIAVPTGTSKAKSTPKAIQYDWTGSKRDIHLEAPINSLEAKLTIKEGTWYRNFVQLHKAKGGLLFKIYATGLAIALFLLLASGFLMAWMVPKYRQLTAITASSGLLIFIILFFIS
jgi:hypothetical protein